MPSRGPTKPGSWRSATSSHEKETRVKLLIKLILLAFLLLLILLAVIAYEQLKIRRANRYSHLPPPPAPTIPRYA